MDSQNVSLFVTPIRLTKLFLANKLVLTVDLSLFTVVDTQFPVIFTDVVWLIRISFGTTGIVWNMRKIIFQVKGGTVCRALHEREAVVGVGRVDDVQVNYTHLILRPMPETNTDF